MGSLYRNLVAHALNLGASGDRATVRQQPWVKKKADLPVAKHFSSPGHTTDDMMVSVVSTGFRDTAQRRSAEGRMISNAKLSNDAA